MIWQELNEKEFSKIKLTATNSWNCSGRYGNSTVYFQKRIIFFTEVIIAVLNV